MPKNHLRLALATATAAALTGGLLTCAAAPATAASAARSYRADFNGDGYGELAIGVPFEDIGPNKDTGSTVVLTGYGLRSGRAISQDTYNVPGSPESMDYFGSDVLLSDVNRDGHADFTVAAGFEDEGVGAITTLRGGAGGVSTAGARSFGPGTFGLSRTYGAFGTGLIG